MVASSGSSIGIARAMHTPIVCVCCISSCSDNSHLWKSSTPSLSWYLRPQRHPPQSSLHIHPSSYRTPRHRDQDLAFHRLNQRHRLVYGVSPSFNTPRLLSLPFPFLQICKLPQVVNCVQIPDLHEPCTYAFHHLPSGRQSLPPVRLPFEKVSRM